MPGAGSDPPEPTWIPATAYPHIMDAILAASDRPTLLAFRAASRALRRAADTHLFTEILLQASLADIDSPSPPEVYPKGTLPGAWDGRGHAEVRLYDPSTRRLPFRRLVPVRNSSWAWSDVFSQDDAYVLGGPRPWPRARFLHTCGLPPSNPRLTLEGLHTHSDLSIQGGAHAVIDAPVLVRRPSPPHDMGPGRMWPTLHPEEVTCPRTLVLPLYSSPNTSFTLAGMAWGVLPPPGGEVVYLFPRPAWDDATGMMQRAARVRALAPALQTALERDARVTIVGLEGLLEWAGARAPAMLERLTGSLLRELSAPERVCVLRREEWEPFVDPLVLGDATYAWGVWNVQIERGPQKDTATWYALEREA